MNQIKSEDDLTVDKCLDQWKKKFIKTMGLPEGFLDDTVSDDDDTVSDEDKPDLRSVYKSKLNSLFGPFSMLDVHIVKGFPTREDIKIVARSERNRVLVVLLDDTSFTETQLTKTFELMRVSIERSFKNYSYIVGDLGLELVIKNGEFYRGRSYSRWKFLMRGLLSIPLPKRFCTYTLDYPKISDIVAGKDMSMSVGLVVRPIEKPDDINIEFNLPQCL